MEEPCGTQQLLSQTQGPSWEKAGKIIFRVWGTSMRLVWFLFAPSVTQTRVCPYRSPEKKHNTTFTDLMFFQQCLAFFVDLSYVLVDNRYHFSFCTVGNYKALLKEHSVTLQSSL